MNFNLLSQNLLTICAMLFAALLAYVLVTPWLQQPTQVKKKKAPQPSLFKKLRFKMVRLTLATALLAVFAQGMAIYLFPDEELPAIFFMALPCCLGIGATVWTWSTRKWYNRTLGLTLAVLGLLVGSLLLNNYYHYYPTLADAFNVRSHQQIAGANQTFVQYSTNKITNKASLETSLQSLGNLPVRGQLYSLSIPPATSHFASRKGWLYVPPVAFSPEKINLPVVVLLAGSPGGPNDWLNGGGALQTLDTFAAQHHGVAPLVAFVDDEGSQNANTGCVDSSRGNVETYLATDVPAYLKANFDVASDPSGWAIGGLSDGGMCGIMLSLRHPNVYRHFLDFGGDIGPKIGTQIATIATLFHGSQQEWQEHQPLYLLQHQSFKQYNYSGFFAVGSSDSQDVLSAVQTLYHQSVANGLDVAYETTEGRHTFGVWQQEFHDALPWLSYHLGATSCVSQCY